MELFVYLIKVNVAILLLYSFYSLLFQRDTFFRWKRIFFLSVLFISLLYPFGETVSLIFSTEINRESLAFPVYNLNEIVIRPTATTLSDSFWSGNGMLQILTGIYLTGVCILTSRIIVQLVILLLHLKQTTVRELFGTKVRVKKGLPTPYSFFGWIVLDPDLYTEKELKEILLHEQTHVRQGHSFDMIFSEMMCVFCWFNPCIWLMKKEIRMNLEYLADHQVLQSGCEIEHYQFHLLQLSYSKTAVQITNNFNVSPLKKRILMMNKKQTSSSGIWKYTLLVPVIAFLVFFNYSLKAQSTVGKVKKEIVTFTPPKISKDVKENKEVDTIKVKKETVTFTPPKILKDGKENKEIFTHVETMPGFPGGEKAMMTYLAENIRYPKEAAEKGIQGRVIVRFVIDPEGKVTDAEIQRSLDAACDAEALRVVNAMPNWTPGKQKGIPVSVYYTLPLLFKLDGDDKKEAAEVATNGIPNDVIYEVDGKEITREELSKIEPATIESVNVEKDKNKVSIILKK
jgi:TonB family protein